MKMIEMMGVNRVVNGKGTPPIWNTGEKAMKMTEKTTVIKVEVDSGPDGNQTIPRDMGQLLGGQGNR